MELPEHLQNLYRHWDLHTVKHPPTAGSSPEDYLSEDLLWFLHERLSMWKKKEAHEDPPYTSDPILSQYRFCNVFREFDKQTIAFHTLLNPIRDDFPLWLLNMFYCRMVARPETITYTGPLSFDSKENEVFYKNLIESPRPRFGAPYVFPVSVIQKSPTPTRETFIAYFLPRIMGAMAQEIETWKHVSVYHGVQKILPLFGYNLSFLWTEVLIDVAYQYPEHLDLFARFPIGPGSAPTFKAMASSEDPSELVATLATASVDTGLTYQGKPLLLSAENWEGIGCEFRKYNNLKAGKGRRRIYRA